MVTTVERQAMDGYLQLLVSYCTQQVANPLFAPIHLFPTLALA